MQARSEVEERLLGSIEAELEKSMSVLGAEATLWAGDGTSPLAARAARAVCYATGYTIMGGTSNPLYALLIAYANDYIAREDMAAASGGFLLINGVGAIIGPIARTAMNTESSHASTPTTISHVG